ncbi:amidohydrolase family protein [Paraburkholderia caballeronis]|uniref:amidohydrolase family protein n=1 Tax=Paraburkholderia caballeronis TaxID=416943 RepID=UPI001065CF3F|nr:amidohydrolase family protein [Paraburkholderia caballeronis]TDV02005.1 cytosine/adenosine deaminase-related metal-dependent hydrolase [Paraburkholderia caballeronis]TDV06724.1 cytosine/adenosine deaminase-related metal-dependent hydrolase [Paraburkholderia caballeronis]TDV16147.1 cytosine/adenosine deaminase-related metal-dependent hydrolase [Paraburkholderia caballeronis]
MLSHLNQIGETDHWAICHTRYFDTAEGRFRTADIEVRGGEVVALGPPGRAKAAVLIDGRGMLFAPGLIGELIVDQGDDCFDFEAYIRDAVLHGITTISLFTDRHASIVPEVRRSGLRAEIYCGHRNRSIEGYPVSATSEVRQAVDRYRSDVHALEDDLISVSPGISSQLFTSSSLTIRLHELAKADGKRLLVNVDSGRPHPELFHDLYACSGTMLLRSLNVLDGNAIAVIDSTLSRRDFDILADSGAHVCVLDGGNLQAGSKVTGILNRIVRSQRGVLLGRSSGAPLETADNAISSQAFGWASSQRARQIGDLIVDAMTRGGSTALGLPTLGRIHAGASADLLAFDLTLPADGDTNAVPDARLLFDLIAQKRPRFVMVAGEWRVKDYTLAGGAAHPALAIMG